VKERKRGEKERDVGGRCNIVRTKKFVQEKRREGTDNSLLITFTAGRE